MSKQTKKTKQDFFQIFGINGSSNLIESNKVSIVRIDIMEGGIARRKAWVTNLIRTKTFPIYQLPKSR